MIQTTWRFLQADYRSHKLRLVGELTGMVLSIGVACLLAWTTPVPPMILAYSIWLLASSILMMTSYSRGSFGLTALYGAFLLIDAIGFIRTLHLEVFYG